MSEERRQPSPPCNFDAAHALIAVTAQIGLALRESQEPVAELGAMIAHVAETLAAVRTAPGAQGAEAAALIEQLQAQAYQGIQRLQFYDRLVQHLSHLQDYLTWIANELSALRDTGHASQPWDSLHSKLRSRLISDEQRWLFDVFLNPDTPEKASAQIKRPELSPPGSMEFF
jgi:predicted metalloprotease with PDZ domain